MKIDVSSIGNEPHFFWTSRVLNQHTCVPDSRVSIFFAAYDEHLALDVRDVIDGTQLRGRNGKPPLQMIQ